LITIVDEAVKIADAEGLDAVSMRRLAEVLEVGTMSLYTHVPGKFELTDLMVDAVHGELYSSVDEVRSQPGGHRERLRFMAERNRALYLRHPWLLEVPLGRPVLGPSAAKNYEADLRALDGIGLSPVEMDSIRALVVLHVQSTARARASNLRAQQADGLTEAEWWTATVPLMQRVMTGEFPVAGRVGKAAGQALAPGPSDEHLFRFGLELICDAVDSFIARGQKVTSDGGSFERHGYWNVTVTAPFASVHCAPAICALMHAQVASEAHSAGTATQPYEGGLQHTPPSLTSQYSLPVLHFSADPHANVFASSVQAPACARGLVA
jgi:AcrR family transcriptional regulator